MPNSSNEVIAAYDYDAWGYALREWKSGDDAKYRFTGKERDNETNYDYFGARYYDARIGRWGGMEPKYEKYITVSPYNYACLNPLKYFDANGLDIFVAFSGYNPLGGQEIPKENYSTRGSGTEMVLYEMQQIAEGTNLEDFDMTGYYTNGVSDIDKAYNFIKNNLDNPDEKIYIYGYSYGGADALRLVNMLKEENIDVEVLFLVDAYHPILSEMIKEYTIPENVKNVQNYVQTNGLTMNGMKVKAKNSQKTKIDSYTKNEYTHKSIDEGTVNEFRYYMKTTVQFPDIYK